jgi:hypothetical protein
MRKLKIKKERKGTRKKRERGVGRKKEGKGWMFGVASERKYNAKYK